ncbi:hypothetical protein Taro_030916 [Colocasia esculenta]|uniref:Uncharacterized protein n=1 Tax=Colocasia esculenta TaxID=4460 RepID=A0A843VML3_COLES|nr:hypothetical protein [Colocasia esculenta]
MFRASETSQQRQGGGDGAVVEVPVTSSGSPFLVYVTLGVHESSSNKKLSSFHKRAEYEQILTKLF